MDEEFALSSVSRMRGLVVVKPIVYGNVAKYFGKKREEDGHTHQWTVYVKPFYNEDMSQYVKKVTFKLHDSYTDCLRVVTAPPYEVTETGWGEFEITIKIHLQDVNEKPVALYHMLKLFQSEANLYITDRNVIAENYDELVFFEPSAMMYQLLQNPKPITYGSYRHDTDFVSVAGHQLDVIRNGQNKATQDISDLTLKLKKRHEEAVRLRDHIQSLKNQKVESNGQASSVQPTEEVKPDENGSDAMDVTSN